MHAMTFRPMMRWGLAIVLMLVLLVAGAVGQARPALAQAPEHGEGLSCTPGGPSFTLTTKDGTILLPDGNTMYMWGYALGNNGFQHPGPVLCVNQGDTVTVILQNALPTDVSIIFPGQEGVTVDGAPSQPQLDISGNVTSFTKPAAANGGSVTYSFVALEPGTYIYESGTDVSKQVPMGLFGALIVRPLGHPNWAYNRSDSQFNPDEEFLMLFSEIDPYLNQAVQGAVQALAPGATLGLINFNMNNYHARYFLLNGRGLPDTMLPNFHPSLPAQPYGALARIYPYDPNPFLADGVTPNPAYNPDPALDRYLNVGAQDYPIHPHGNNGIVIGRDGHATASASGGDLSFEKFSMPIAPGQTWDLLFSWHDDNNYSMDNPVTVPVPDPNNITNGMFYSGSPYLGMMGPMPPGMIPQSQCGEYYIIAHNHALYQLTSWGLTMSGPGTFTRVDPPLPNMCP
jgi:FtsP/CotA-like multicopper oxidase with cupredoxin domain